MQTFYFTLAHKYEFCEQLYYPGINTVVMRAENGKRIQLPVKNLRPHVSPIGINGRFRLIIDDDNKIVSFEKIA
ncbi:DUF2835 family protein [uncultured Paraglaciecola sp.]|uniref:DUF2835 family protein n=1 Tax=uncultured Paraglaciecola sp. TaxID=1765024 RepID=UPI002604A2E5|nr:DUF2835 family protein [uncultured Paraglaciecola sp.]